MAALPGCILPSVAAELERAWADSPEWLEEVERMARRPAMAKVFRALAAKLPEPEQWRVFLLAVFEAKYFARLYLFTIKPDRKQFPVRRAKAVKAAQRLAAELDWLLAADHDYEIPAEINFLWLLVHSAARASGYTNAAADALSRPMRDDLVSGLDALIRGEPGPAPLRLSDLLRHLATALESWTPDPGGQGQGTAEGPVFVRALDDILAEHGMSARSLLTDEQTAALTRAALGLREEPSAAGAPSFGPANVREARAYAKK